ncbi:hypothetical protein GUJ93_ZPchr0012g20574 [Zizania palustris]|uniref:Uncharacterized protein n=1 Tax=Zizania palustris TaxID=103762 RepID=A0A8J5WMP8_ZIZPA|nr:hypothetical protein GUJ93_ZPchr0012g20574 [Zizania palustris]
MAAVDWLHMGQASGERQRRGSGSGALYLVNGCDGVACAIEEEEIVEAIPQQSAPLELELSVCIDALERVVFMWEVNDKAPGCLHERGMQSSSRSASSQAPLLTSTCST